MLKFVIEDTTVEVKRGTSQRTNQPYEIRYQKAVVKLGREVREVNVNLDRDQVHYQKGEYVISDASYEVGRYGDLQIGRLVLQPVAQASNKAA